MTSQLERLAKPFPDRLIHSNPSGGGSYVKHSVVTEKLLAVLGPFSFELVEIVRGHVAEIAPNPQGKSARAKAGAPALDHSIVGAVCRLRVVVDSVPVSIEEVGDCESPHNWPHDGARLKDAMSDSLKRAAMRLGVTLHLWSGAEFSLYEQLHASNENAPVTTDGLGGQDVEGNRGGNSGPSAAPSPSTSVSQKNRRQALKARCVALTADGISVADAREAEALPIVDSCNEEQLAAFEALVSGLEAGLEAPFDSADPNHTEQAYAK